MDRQIADRVGTLLLLVGLVLVGLMVALPARGGDDSRGIIEGIEVLLGQADASSVIGSR